jgi:hypothetical protein
MPTERNRKRRGHAFYPTEADALPALYATDGQGKDAVARVRYFGPGESQWLVTEYDPETGMAFGWAEIFPGGGELGYIPLEELEAVSVGPLGMVVERDADFTPTPLRDVLVAQDAASPGFGMVYTP